MVWSPTPWPRIYHSMVFTAFWMQNLIFLLEHIQYIYIVYITKWPMQQSNLTLLQSFATQTPQDTPGSKSMWATPENPNCSLFPRKSMATFIATPKYPAPKKHVPLYQQIYSYIFHMLNCKHGNVVNPKINKPAPKSHKPSPDSALLVYGIGFT